MKYSICFLDASGGTRRSEFDAYESDEAAIEYARGELDKSDIVEVWLGENLLARLEQEAAQKPASKTAAKPALSRAHLESWDNEGGAVRPRAPAIASQAQTT